ncbi:MAG TPA: HAD hydrolase-like protein [Candidatus Ozemobacteraceae bacterium]|nr:HAD hydrolase-like protein [Candidatus Ozemobacteraceae bacterium]
MMAAFHFDAIVFDFDGVILESVDVKTRAFAALYAEYGPEVVRQVVEYHLRHGGISRFIKFRYYHETLLGKVLSPDDEQVLSERFSSLVLSEILASPWVAGAEAFLRKYCRILPLFVASGTPQEELEMIIERRGITRCFVSCHGTPSSKGQIIASIVKRHGFNPGRVLMIGDAMADYEGAREAGVRFLGRLGTGSTVFPPDVATVRDLDTLETFITAT